jgi:hypothetical protein
MNRSLKDDWGALKRSKPGRRFQDRYDRHKEAGRKAPWKRALNLAIAVLSLAIALVLVVIPGPAILFFFISGGLLATESRFIAVGLDRLEVLLRAGWLSLRRFWSRRSRGGKATLLGVAALLVGVTLHVSYRLILVR